MATITESVPGPQTADRAVPTVLARLRKLLVPWTEAPAADVEEIADLTLFGRVRKFLWLASGLFSAASFAIPAIGFLAFGTFDGNGTNFLAAIVSAFLFGIASLLHFGPEEA